jgi:hypothetical protein
MFVTRKVRQEFKFKNFVVRCRNVVLVVVVLAKKEEEGEDNLQESCFMRCDEPQLEESNYICEDYGMICHYSKVCGDTTHLVRGGR